MEALVKEPDTKTEDISFYNHYMTARQITMDKEKLENEMIQTKKQLDIKDSEVKNANMEIK